MHDLTHHRPRAARRFRRLLGTRHGVTLDTKVTRPNRMTFDDIKGATWTEISNAVTQRVASFFSPDELPATGQWRISVIPAEIALAGDGTIQMLLWGADVEYRW